MALLDEEMTWSFANGSMSLLDFIDSDDNKENDSFIFNEPLLQIPTDGFKDDIFDLLSIEELHSLSDIKPSVTQDSLPSYDQIIADCAKAVKSEECFSFDKLNISNIKSEPVTIKQEPVECSNLTALRAVTPASHYNNKLRYGLDTKPLTHNLDTIFQKEDSMSISLDDITSIINNNQDLADSLSPISPNSISSEGSSETFISSGLSDFESTSPKRAPLSGPTKKPRRRKATDSTNSPHLWQFILELLGNTDNKDVIAWTGLEHHFKVHNSRELARLWGMRKNKPRMNFDKLSRAMRYYYDKNIIRHIPGQRLVYKFCRNADDAVYTRLLTEASRTIPPLPLVTCTARTPTKVPTKTYPAKYSPLSPSTPAYKASLTKSVKDAFSEQQQLSAQQRYYIQQQQLQRQQQSCYNAQVQLQQQEQVRQQQQLAAQQQQIQLQQMQLNQCVMSSPQQNGSTTSHMLQGMSPVQGMQYQPLQHFTPQQSCYDEFYTMQGNCSPNMTSPSMPTIQGSPNHLIQSSPNHLINGSATSQLLQGSPTSSMMYAPVSTTSYTYDNNFYQPY